MTSINYKQLRTGLQCRKNKYNKTQHEVYNKPKSNFFRHYVMRSELCSRVKVDIKPSK